MAASKVVFLKSSHGHIVMSVMAKLFNETVLAHNKHIETVTRDWLEANHPSIIKRRSAWEAIKTVVSDEDAMHFINTTKSFSLNTFPRNLSKSEGNPIFKGLRRDDLSTFYCRDNENTKLFAYLKDVLIHYTGGKNDEIMSVTLDYGILTAAQCHIESETSKGALINRARVCRSMDTLCSTFPILNKGNNYRDHASFFLQDLSEDQLKQWSALVKPLNEATLKLVHDMNDMQEHLEDTLAACVRIEQLDTAWPEHRKFIPGEYYIRQKNLPAIIVPNEKLRTLACSYLPGTCEDGSFQPPEDCGGCTATVAPGAAVIAAATTMQSEVLAVTLGEAAK